MEREVPNGSSPCRRVCREAELQLCLGITKENFHPQRNFEGPHHCQEWVKIRQQVAPFSALPEARLLAFGLQLGKVHLSSIGLQGKTGWLQWCSGSFTAKKSGKSPLFSDFYYIRDFHTHPKNPFSEVLTRWPWMWILLPICSGRWQGYVYLRLNCVSKVSFTTGRIKDVFSKGKTMKGQELYNVHDLVEIYVDFYNSWQVLDNKQWKPCVKPVLLI